MDVHIHPHANRPSHIEGEGIDLVTSFFKEKENIVNEFKWK